MKARLRAWKARTAAAMERAAAAVNDGPLMPVHGPDGSLMWVPRPETTTGGAMTTTYPPAKTRGRPSRRPSAGQLYERVEAALELLDEIEDAGGIGAGDAAELRATLRGHRPDLGRVS